MRKINWLLEAPSFILSDLILWAISSKTSGADAFLVFYSTRHRASNEQFLCHGCVHMGLLFFLSGKLGNGKSLGNGEEPSAT